MDDNLSQDARQRRHYSFETIAACNMCGESSDNTRTMGMRLDKSQGLRPRALHGIAVSVCRCRNCGLIYSNPQPRPRAISEHYGIPPDSYWQAYSFDTQPGYFQREIQNAKRLLNFKPGMRALDIGVGMGLEVYLLREAGFEVFGIEPSEPFFIKARERLGMDEAHLKLAPVEEAEFPEGTFDLVTFGAVLEHLYDPDAAITNAMRWLKPGGFLQAEVPNSDHLIAKLINLYFRGIGTGFVTNLSPMHVPFHLYEFSIDSFRAHAARRGYTVAEHRVEGATIRNIPAFLHPLFRWWMARNGSGLQLHVWLRKE